MSLTNRYDVSKIQINSNKKRVYASTLYPLIEKSYEDIYILSNDSDRLDLLAYKYYGNPKLWWIIAQANNLGKGSFNVPPGIQLRIPKNTSKILEDFNSLNDNR
jgi:hypothetical protein